MTADRSARKASWRTTMGVYGRDLESRYFPIFSRHAELVSASIVQPRPKLYAEKWTLKQVQGDVE